MFSIILWIIKTQDSNAPNPNKDMILLFDSYSFVLNGSRRIISIDKKMPKIKLTNTFPFKDDVKCICLLKKLNLLLYLICCVFKRLI